MNRVFGFGVAAFVAIVGIALLGGSNNKVLAGHGCHGGGCGGDGGCDGGYGGGDSCSGYDGCSGGDACGGGGRCHGKRGGFLKGLLHHRKNRCSGRSNGCSGAHECPACCEETAPSCSGADAEPTCDGAAMEHEDDHDDAPEGDAPMTRVQRTKTFRVARFAR